VLTSKGASGVQVRFVIALVGTLPGDSAIPVSGMSLFLGSTGGVFGLLVRALPRDCEYYREWRGYGGGGALGKRSGRRDGCKRIWLGVGTGPPESGRSEWVAERCDIVVCWGRAQQLILRRHIAKAG